MSPLPSASWLLVLSLAVWSASGVDRSKFRSCAQSAFCQRCRNEAADQSAYRVDLATLTEGAAGVEAVVVNGNNEVRFRLEIFALADATFRVRLREAYPLIPRFEVPHVLDGEPETVKMEVKDKNAEGVTLVAGDNKAVVKAKPFTIDFYSGGVHVLSTNARGLLRFEQTRPRKDEPLDDDTKDFGAEDYEGDDEAKAAAAANAGKGDVDEPGMWTESFGGNTDSKPNGPQAVALDFSWINTDNVYGIPEHADRFSLRDTSGGDPYRLYNLDVFEYELWNPMALYGAVPFMIGHNKERTTGVFWLNAAETWIDVKKSSSGVLGSISNFVGGSSSAPRVDTHWMSESGIIDAFIVLGPGPKDVSRQYGRLTGNTPLPPEFSLAYHQCRWNYNDQDDVRTVADKFDEYDMPMDIMWLDIEHTDGKKYFTWDGRKFGDSLGMIQNLTAVGRKLVTIVDPHIKKDSSYWVHKDCTDLGLYTKNKDGSDYEGWCWPGASYYPDFLNPAAREYFAEQYKFDKYQGTTEDVFTWNDMNEPSVFNGPEVTMPKDLIHYGNFEHRDLHNLYGHLYVMGTFQGQLLRSDNKLRPFILTRSAFAGSQKIAAKWTGDNAAEWGHLEASVPMCLSLSIAGISFCGADVGGFFGNPDGELFVRWYQAAAWQPFFRSHAHIDSKRREPWLFNEHEMKLIRKALRTRYSILPYMYTLFYEGEKTGVPPMRPVWYEFPDDEETFATDDQHMLGPAFLVHPVSKSNENHALVHFPGEGQIWYDILTHEKIDHHGAMNIPVNFESIPVYQRGGTIVPKKERVRRSSTLMRNDPYTLVVAVDAKGNAEGTLYIDDGKTYDYRSGSKRLYMKFEWSTEKKSLKCVQLEKPGYETKSWLEKVVIVGLSGSPGAKASMKSAAGKSELSATFERQVLTIRKPGVNMAEEWEISF